jgi:hypothetical protein
MNRLLEQAIAAAAALPEDRQAMVAARILDEVRRQTPGSRWSEVADRLARLDAFRGESVVFDRHVRQFRESFRPRNDPGA